MSRLVHLLGSLEVGGMQRGTLQLLNQARREHLDHRLVLFDSPPLGEPIQYDVGTIPVEHLPRRSGVDLRFARTLGTYLDKHRIELIHTHNDSAMFYGVLARRYAKVTPKPAVIAGFHTQPGHSTFGARIAARWASKRASRVVAVSEELGQLLVTTGWIRDFITVLNGVDLATFAPVGPRGEWRHSLEVPNGALLIGHVGRFDSVKRQEDLIDAAGRLVGHEPPLIFVLVGQGPDRDSMLQRAAGCPAIRFVERITDMASFYRALDVFVLCSEHEATPRALLEAMSCGVPVVATSVGGIPFVLDTAGGLQTGLVVPPRRPDLLAQRISELAKDSTLRRTVSDAGIKRAQVFSVEREWHRYRSLYAEVLSEVLP